MKAIGRAGFLSNHRLVLVAAALLVLLASLVLVSKSVYAKASSACASDSGCLNLTDRAARIVDQSANTRLVGSDKGVQYTPMPAAYHSDNAMPVPNEQDQPLISDLFLIVLGFAGTVLAVGPLVLAAVLDIRSTHQQ